MRGRFVRAVRKVDAETAERQKLARKWIAQAKGEPEPDEANDAYQERTLRVPRRKPGSESAASERHAQVNNERRVESEA
jgi:non-homologous end joining protein Ku